MAWQDPLPHLLLPGSEVKKKTSRGEAGPDGRRLAQMGGSSPVMRWCCWIQLRLKSLGPRVLHRVLLDLHRSSPAQWQLNASAVPVSTRPWADRSCCGSPEPSPPGLLPAVSCGGQGRAHRGSPSERLWLPHGEPRLRMNQALAGALYRQLSCGLCPAGSWGSRAGDPRCQPVDVAAVPMAWWVVQWGAAGLKPGPRAQPTSFLGVQWGAGPLGAH